MAHYYQNEVTLPFPYTRSGQRFFFTEFAGLQGVPPHRFKVRCMDRRPTLEMPAHARRHVVYALPIRVLICIIDFSCVEHVRCLTVDRGILANS